MAQVWSPPASTLPATAPGGEVAIEAPASPAGGAAAEAERARPNERRAAARAIAPQRPSRRAWRGPTARIASESRRRPLRAANVLSMLAPYRAGASARSYHRTRGRSMPRRKRESGLGSKPGASLGEESVDLRV